MHICCYVPGLHVSFLYPIPDSAPLLGKAYQCIYLQVAQSILLNYYLQLFAAYTVLLCSVHTRIVFAILCTYIIHCSYLANTVWPCWVCGEHERLRKTPLSPHRYLGELPFSDDMHRLSYTQTNERTHICIGVFFYYF